MSVISYIHNAFNVHRFCLNSEVLQEIEFDSFAYIHVCSCSFEQRVIPV